MTPERQYLSNSKIPIIKLKQENLIEWAADIPPQKKSSIKDSLTLTTDKITTVPLHLIKGLDRLINDES